MGERAAEVRDYISSTQHTRKVSGSGVFMVKSTVRSHKLGVNQHAWWSLFSRGKENKC